MTKRMVTSIAACGVLAIIVLAVLIGCRSLHDGDKMAVTPSSYTEQVRRCIAAAEAATGLRCIGLRRAYFADTGRKAWSSSLRRYVAVDEDGQCGKWTPGEIRVCTLAGSVPDEIVIHEIAHQIAADNGLAATDHCAEFVGRVWGWL
jgi:hypothetical protein